MGFDMCLLGIEDNVGYNREQQGSQNATQPRSFGKIVGRVHICIKPKALAEVDFATSPNEQPRALLAHKQERGFLCLWGVGMEEHRKPVIRDKHGYEEGACAAAVVHERGIDEISVEVQDESGLQNGSL
jgi:hypothetical protein